jgi:hypothetical protein
MSRRRQARSGERHVQWPAHLWLLLLLRPAGCLGAASAGSMILGGSLVRQCREVRQCRGWPVRRWRWSRRWCCRGGRAAGCTPRLAHHPLPKGRPVRQLRALSLHVPLPWPGGAAQTCWSWLARVCSCRAACLVCAGRSPWLPPAPRARFCKKNNSATAGLWGVRSRPPAVCAHKWSVGGRGACLGGALTD